jgi:hypothetical protein
VRPHIRLRRYSFDDKPPVLRQSGPACVLPAVVRVLCAGRDAAALWFRDVSASFLPASCGVQRARAIASLCIPRDSVPARAAHGKGWWGYLRGLNAAICSCFCRARTPSYHHSSPSSLLFLTPSSRFVDPRLGVLHDEYGPGNVGHTGDAQP